MAQAGSAQFAPTADRNVLADHAHNKQSRKHRPPQDPLHSAASRRGLDTGLPTIAR